MEDYSNQSIDSLTLFYQCYPSYIYITILSIFFHIFWSINLSCLIDLIDSSILSLWWSWLVECVSALLFCSSNWSNLLFFNPSPLFWWNLYQKHHKTSAKKVLKTFLRFLTSPPKQLDDIHVLGNNGRWTLTAVPSVGIKSRGAHWRLERNNNSQIKPNLKTDKLTSFSFEISL